MEDEAMKVQRGLFNLELTPEQEAQEERAFAAAKLLREHGYKARANKYVVTSPKDRAAEIEIK